MNKERRKIIGSLIRHEMVDGTHTVHQCECNRHTARGGRCWECLVECFEENKEFAK